MTRIFIEAKHKNTTESVFITTLLQHLGIAASSYEICCVDGKDNLDKNEVKFRENTLTGGRNLIIIDADTPATGCGYTVTKERILSTFPGDVVIDGLYLFPHNHDDGIFENLLEELTLKDTHSIFFDCFSDYEKCLGDEYVSPDIKGKLHTYMSAQKALSKTQRRALGSGQWLFNDTRFWNLDVPELQPLKDFLKANVL